MKSRKVKAMLNKRFSLEPKAQVLQSDEAASLQRILGWKA